MQDPKPNLSVEGIQANIDYYESLVAHAKDSWEQHLNTLQFWIDELEKSHDAVKNS